MIINRDARPTLTAIELDCGDELRFTCADGSAHTLSLVSTRAAVDSSSIPYREPVGRLVQDHSARIVLRMHATVQIDGARVDLVRWVGNQRSFADPYEIAGLRIWFDGAAALFDYLGEGHGACRPRRAARFAVQDATDRICLPMLHPWCPLPKRSLRITDCYAGSDCWMGPYAGYDAHGGLDINHAAGTPLWAPVGLDRHGLFDSVTDGAANNCWRGTRRWADGSTWILEVHHVIDIVAPPGSVEAGTLVAHGAGIAVGAYEHSHFVFAIVEPGASEGEAIVLDPWILFWQMYRDRTATTAAGSI